MIEKIYHIEQNIVVNPCDLQCGYTSEPYKFCISDDLALLAQTYNIPYYEGGHTDVGNSFKDDGNVLCFADGVELTNRWKRKGCSLYKLREAFPNGKIVIMMTDAQYNFHNITPSGQHNGYVGWVLENDMQEYNVVDMLLCVDQGPLALYKKGTSVDCNYLIWSISEATIQKLTQYNINQEKSLDFLCMMRVVSFNQYRTKLKDYLYKSSYNIMFEPNKINCSKNNFKNLYDMYNKTWFIFGTTSSNIPHRPEKCMKGFRDFLAPFCNSVLIYDNYPDVLKYFTDSEGVVVPIYNYSDWTTINKIYDELTNNLDLYNNYIERQKQWAMNNTLYKQFLRLFKEWF